jgi:hypothetical protein
LEGGRGTKIVPFFESIKKPLPTVLKINSIGLDNFAHCPEKEHSTLLVCLQSIPGIWTDFMNTNVINPTVMLRF